MADEDVLNVIVCEPSGVQRQILARSLTSAGYRVYGASTASEALALIRSGVGDILMTGLELPDSSGYVRNASGISNGYGPTEDCHVP